MAPTPRTGPGTYSLPTLVDPTDTNYVHYTGVFTGSGSDTITFSDEDLFGYWSLDNVSVTLASVPEPAAWAIMLLGFGFAGSALRRRRTLAAA
ncbi:MAG: PEP-CTERM sorting domain-containing protein [Phenylobacterium sp.]|nr:MAG: PEP-CTERM sorting domain-containing protein [Phenylobacterium sp.]